MSSGYGKAASVRALKPKYTIYQKWGRPTLLFVLLGPLLSMAPTINMARGWTEALAAVAQIIARVW